MITHDRCRRCVRNIGFAMLGTTHCTNAIVERKRLEQALPRCASVRSGDDAPSSCMADWPDRAEERPCSDAATSSCTAGNEFDGREISAPSMKTRCAARSRASCAKRRLRQSVAVTSVFSPVSDAPREARRRHSCARSSATISPSRISSRNRQSLELPRARERLHLERGARTTWRSTTAESFERGACG